MLDADSISVWLERGSEPALIRPFARATERSSVEYRIDVRRAGLSGQSSVAQAGRQVLERDAATALGTIRINRSPHDVCTVEVSIVRDGGTPIQMRFVCPPP